jgi:hypothetical protein
LLAETLKKGNALEDSVRAIEFTILRSFPGYSESTFRIEGKKILSVEGVRHEIDLYVSVSLGAGYGAVFIFECRNRQEKADKNDIIVFAEKIHVANAQRGFFVAKAYTADAVAQAKKDERIELLSVAEFEPAAVEVPGAFHGIQLGETHSHLSIRAKSATIGEFPVDLETALLTLDAVETPLKPYATEWIQQASNRRCDRFPSGLVEDGMHVLEFDESRKFEVGQAVVDGFPVAEIQLTGTVQVYVSRAVVVSAFEVATRGRVVTVRVEMPLGQLQAQFVQLTAKSSGSA